MISLCRLIGHAWKPDRFGYPKGTCRHCGHETYPQHRWDDKGVVLEEGVSAQWARRDIACTRCGQERRVFWGLDLSSIADTCQGSE